jgi:hypothetical protein
MDKWNELKIWVKDRIQYIENNSNRIRPDWEIEWDKAQKSILKKELEHIKNLEEEIN